ncbi:MAG: carcinine hydrolase/isopenicillin-N N-acyltransferase family protein [Acidimicrobiia bacterium]
MCDVVAIVSDDEILFAKNSDRDANESQFLEWQQRADHPAGSTLRCTHVEIPQAEQTWAVLLSRPFWMWGAEMGANEHGVVIGNEAVFTRHSVPKTGLTGMDLVRLALERARNADEAVETITSLAATHGQGGRCGYERTSFRYHSSFIIADRAGARLLETAGNHWAVEDIRGTRTISNGLTIPDFAAENSDRLKTALSGCKVRRALTEQRASGGTDVSTLMSVLRDHGGTEWPTYRRLNGTQHMPCQHGGSGIISSLSTASWVSRLSEDGVQHWVTATSSPCLSLFKPVSVDDPLALGPTPEGIAGNSLWWTHERLHRRVMKDPETLASIFADEREALESQWLHDIPYSAEAFAEHRRRLDDWLERVGEPTTDTRPGFARRYWAKRNRLARISLAS